MDLLDFFDESPPCQGAGMTDLGWALACEDFTYHPNACDRCPGCHAVRCNRTTGPTGQRVLNPTKPWICEGPPDQPHPEVVVPQGGRCPVCG